MHPVNVAISDDHYIIIIFLNVKLKIVDSGCGHWSWSLDRALSDVIRGNCV